VWVWVGWSATVCPLRQNFTSFYLLPVFFSFFVGGGGGGFGRSKQMEAGASLRAPDWSRIDLIAFQKDFYTEHPEVQAMTDAQVSVVSPFRR